MASESFKIVGGPNLHDLAEGFARRWEKDEDRRFAFAPRFAIIREQGLKREIMVLVQSLEWLFTESQWIVFIGITSMPLSEEFPENHPLDLRPIKIEGIYNIHDRNGEIRILG